MRPTAAHASVARAHVARVRFRDVREHVPFGGEVLGACAEAEIGNPDPAVEQDACVQPGRRREARSGVRPDLRRATTLSVTSTTEGVDTVRAVVSLIRPEPPVRNRSRRSTKGELTRRRILDEAVRHFGANGYRATSVSEIARAAGVTPSATYAYFPDKGTLFAAALAHDLAQWLAPVETELPPGPTPVLDAVALVVTGLVQHPLVSWTLREGDREQLGLLLGASELQRVRDSVADVISARLVVGDQSGAAAPQLALAVETVVVALMAIAVRVGRGFDPARVRAVAELCQRALGGPLDAAEWQTALERLPGQPGGKRHPSR